VLRRSPGVGRHKLRLLNSQPTVLL
jgi:hypothetical protein